MEDEDFQHAKGVFGRCYLKLYQGHHVVSKEFRNRVTKDDVLAEARVLQSLSHPGLPVVLGVNLDFKPYIMVTLFYGINKNNTILFVVLSSRDQGHKISKIHAINIIK